MGCLAILGNSFQFKEDLKQDGFKFNFDQKVWFKDNIELENSKVLMNQIPVKYPNLEACYVEDINTLKSYLDLDTESSIANPINSNYTNKIIEVTNWYAKVFKQNNNTNFIFRNFKILNVYVETQKALQVDIEYFGGVASCCGVCGRSLDNDISIATGIGPICASKIGLPRPTLENAKEIINLMEEMSKKQGVFERVWIPKSQIKNII